MKEMRILTALGQVDEQYIEESAPANEAEPAKLHVKRHISLAFVAVLAALLLVGCTVAVTIYGDDIQSWFAHRWESINGNPMSTGQTAVIEQLSQKIDVSQTVGDVTVTVDSATMGDDTFFLLLRVEGLHFSKRYDYEFREYTWETEPDPFESNGGIGSGGIEYLGLDGDGTALMLMDVMYKGSNGYTEYIDDTSPLTIVLTLKDLVRFTRTRKEKTLIEGEWKCTFSLDRTKLPEVISLPDTEVILKGDTSEKRVPAMVRNIELTNTGIRFELNDNDYDRTLFFSEQINVLLKNGNCILNNGGVATPLAEGNVCCWSFNWKFPIDLDEVECVQFGETKILVGE